MAKRCPEIDEIRTVREETLDLVAGLTQEQADYRPGLRKWSLGEVLDHLRLTDDSVRRDLERLIAKKRSGKSAFLCKSLADLEMEVPLVPKIFNPFVEMPVAFFNLFIPGPVRRAVTSARQVPLRRPDFLAPQRGRPIDQLRRELEAGVEKLEKLQDDNPKIDFRDLRYYSPILGFNTVPGVLRFIIGHERRHQGQIRDVKAGSGFKEVE